MDNNLNFSEKNFSTETQKIFNENIIDITQKIQKQKIFLNGKDITEILKEIEENPEFKKYYNYRIVRTENLFSLENEEKISDCYLFFKKPIIIYYKNVSISNKQFTLIDKKVTSTFQIELTMKIYNIKYLIYENEKGSFFPKYKSFIIEYINDNISNINFICFMDEIQFKSIENSLDSIPKNINLNSLSKYSKEYFKYSEDKIEYFSNTERKKLLSKLNEFIESDINFFKIAGPSNNGKSITLFLFSRLKRNIIYLNLKYIMKLFYLQDKEYLNVINYEFGRAILNEKEILELKNIINSKIFIEPWNIIFKLFNLLISKELILIFDQFKDKNVDSYIFKNIEEKILGNKIKIIICSCINDESLKTQILKTIEVFHGNPPYFNKDSEKYYYYYSNLLNVEDLKLICGKNPNDDNELFNQFNYNPKYIYIFRKSNESYYKTVEKIKLHIISKIKEGFSEKFLVNDILYLTSLKVGIELDYEENFNILVFSSLKYFTLELNKTFFKIYYSFNYIKSIIDEIDIKKNIEDFFIYEKFKHSKFYKLLNSNYFEKSCIYSIQNNNLLPSDYSYFLSVNTITELDENENLIFLNKNKLINELTIKEYYEMNIKTINNVIEKYNLMEIKENDINYHLFQGLNLKKQNLNNFLNKKKSIENDKNENNKIYIYDYKDTFYNGGILIDQSNQNDKILDFGFLYGGKNSKIFLGFQMKMYSKNIKLNEEKRKKLNKDKIKDSLNKFLVQTLIKYNMIIQEWHYFLISYYNPINNYYNEDLVKICENEGIEYLFYYPNTHTFYNKNFEEINKIKLTFNSNLDYSKDNNPNLIFANFQNFESNVYEYCKISSLKKKLYDNVNLFIKKCEKKIELLEVNRYLKNKIGKLTLNLIAIYKYSNNMPFPIPNKFYLFLFLDINKKDFIYYYNYNNAFSSGYVLKENDYELGSFFLSKYINSDKNNLEFLVYKFN